MGAVSWSLRHQSKFVHKLPTIPIRSQPQTDGGQHANSRKPEGIIIVVRVVNRNRRSESGLHEKYPIWSHRVSVLITQSVRDAPKLVLRVRNLIDGRAFPYFHSFFPHGDG